MNCSFANSNWKYFIAYRPVQIYNQNISECIFKHFWVQFYGS